MGLANLPGFAVGLILFRTEGRHLQVLLSQPEWLRTWSDEWLLPETTLEAEESISECADRLAASLSIQRPSPSTQLGTYTRGKLVVGALATCYACVPHDASIRRSPGAAYRWVGVEGLRSARIFRDLALSVYAAIDALADDLQNVAKLISKPFFTVVELQQALNELRRLVGRAGQVDVRNLRRTLNDADWLMDTTDIRSDGAHRPSKLFMVK